ncbi:PhzF family phenazine biosynthesis protein [Acinetobacter stercoris]|uniref:Putative isomerase YddE n=1 Tax=Acinetobacter stercoris TaxID=2126983 RepID=A0A2U3MYS0_9GAMM|nr:PhzF family phenazine biosynthesis protein [Acinetobacter stercoris]SPL70570.1 putative isomerase YddE [Acinetobacter stercoris]
MKMYQVDAFTKELFKGNPAAVLVLDEWLDEQLMQNIAAENNLAETAFVKRIDTENYEIRWFTPKVEVDFCGHATLASAFVLFQFFTELKEFIFHVKNLGQFIIRQDTDGKITMNFPIRPVSTLENYPALLNEVIDRPIQDVYINEQAYILVLESEQDVIEAIPNLENIRKIQLDSLQNEALDTKICLDVTITSLSQKYDYVSRYFAPLIGIDEDPVTGSMHTGLAPFWAEKLAKRQLVGYQASERGGELYSEILENQRIEISGYAKLFMQAEIEV